jgi:adenylosuccinate synthase
MAIHVCVGGQFGSEAKGHATQWLCDRLIKRGERVFNIRTGGPNAGHTAYVENSEVPFRFRQLPVGVLNPRVQAVGLAAGSEINLEVLNDEIGDVEAHGIEVNNRLWIDSEATIIEQRHIDEEQSMIAAIGSTAKGIGAARAARIMRNARRFTDVWEKVPRAIPMITHEQIRLFLHSRVKSNIVIEGAQGYGLGLHAGYYPYCTSGDCRVIDNLAACGILPTEYRLVPWVVFRTHPIRVAGNSGPLKDEMSFEELGNRIHTTIEPERTTVTNRIRRIGGWDSELASAAISANGGDYARVVLTFIDYWYPELYGMTSLPTDHPIHRRLGNLEDEIGARIWAVSTSPTTMIQVRMEDL